MNKKKFKQQFGPWALVTGASSGIGYEFVLQLADLGLNLVLVARRSGSLDTLADSLRRTHSIQVRVLAVDLTSNHFLELIAEATRDLEIGLLVSNAGDDYMGAFHRVPLEQIKRMIRLNVNAHAELAHYFGGLMLDREKRGGILMVSSTAGFQGTPYVGNYAGAKAYILNLGEALHYELRKTKIHVSVLVPGPTSTPAFHDRKDIDLNQMPVPPMKVVPVVSGALRALAGRKPFYIPGLMNRMMAGLMGRRILTRGDNVAMWGLLMDRAAPAHLKIN